MAAIEVPGTSSMAEVRAGAGKSCQAALDTVLHPWQDEVMKTATRVTSKGQVVIPKPVREQLRWASGTQLAVETMGNGAVRLSPIEAEGSIDILFGCLTDLPEDPVGDLEAEHRAEIEADERWSRRGR
jgi:AbrB family looped-hinge helix DNA binding protein